MQEKREIVEARRLRLVAPCRRTTGGQRGGMSTHLIRPRGGTAETENGANSPCPEETMAGVGEGSVPANVPAPAPAPAPALAPTPASQVATVEAKLRECLTSQASHAGSHFVVCYTNIDILHEVPLRALAGGRRTDLHLWVEGLVDGKNLILLNALGGYTKYGAKELKSSKFDLHTASELNLRL